MIDDAASASPRWDRASLLVVAGLCALKVVTHLLLVRRYGYHGDELYFLECGRHLSAGYVDHPPLIPWIARLSDELGGSLVILRLPAIAAGAGTMVFTALIVREWRGGWRAQLMAMLCLLLGPAHLRIGAMLNIPVIEVFLATVTAYLVARALSRAERWTLGRSRQRLDEAGANCQPRSRLRATRRYRSGISIRIRSSAHTGSIAFLRWTSTTCSRAKPVRTQEGVNETTFAIPRSLASVHVWQGKRHTRIPCRIGDSGWECEPYAEQDPDAPSKNPLR